MKSLLLSLSMAVLLFFITACECNEQDTLHKIRRNGETKIAVSLGFIPFGFYGKDRELTGFDIDIAKQIAQHLGVKAVIVDVPWNKIIETLRSGSCDAIVSSMAVTEDGPLSLTSPSLITIQDHTFLSEKGPPSKKSPMRRERSLAARKVPHMSAKPVCWGQKKSLRASMMKRPCSSL